MTGDLSLSLPESALEDADEDDANDAVDDGDSDWEAVFNQAEWETEAS